MTENGIRFDLILVMCLKFSLKCSTVVIVQIDTSSVYRQRLYIFRNYILLTQSTLHNFFAYVSSQTVSVFCLAVLFCVQVCFFVVLFFITEISVWIYCRYM